MQWAVWLRAAALHALWEFVALCFAPNPAPEPGHAGRLVAGALLVRHVARNHRSQRQGVTAAGCQRQ